MQNIIKFRRPDNKDKKCNSPLAIKVMFSIFIILAIVKLFALDDLRPLIYRQHNVVMLKTPVAIPDDYIVNDLYGKQLKLSDLLGDKITILAFWATWCGYCAAEFPYMDSVAPYLSRHGVKIIPIARGDDTNEKITQFFERGHIKNVETFIPPTSQLHKLLGISAYPSYVAIDENGKAFARLRPKWNSSDIFELFEKLEVRN